MTLSDTVYVECLDTAETLQRGGVAANVNSQNYVAFFTCLLNLTSIVTVSASALRDEARARLEGDGAPVAEALELREQQRQRDGQVHAAHLAKLA